MTIVRVTPEARSNDELPGILREIAEIAGYAAALQVAAARGGCQHVRFPRPRGLKGHWLVQACGMDGARRIAAVLGTNKFTAVRAASPAHARGDKSRALEGGASAAKIARDVGGCAHESTVWRHKAREGTSQMIRADRIAPAPPAAKRFFLFHVEPFGLRIGEDQQAIIPALDYGRPSALTFFRVNKFSASRENPMRSYRGSTMTIVRVFFPNSGVIGRRAEGPYRRDDAADVIRAWVGVAATRAAVS